MEDLETAFYRFASVFSGDFRIDALAQRGTCQLLGKELSKML